MAEPTGRVVLDANVAVALVALLPWSADAEAKITAWQCSHTPRWQIG